MKIIGESNNGHYVAIVSKDEIEKAFDKFYGKMPAIKVGDIINLAHGYNFRNDIQRVCNSMQESMRHFSAAQHTLQQFAMMVADQTEDNVGQK